MESSAEAESLRLLSGRSFALCLAIVLAVFVGLNPLWDPTVGMDEVTQNIVWSYAPIPLLVLLFLAVERKLGWGPWIVETLRLTFVKFAITFLAAHGVWAITGAPEGEESPLPPAIRTESDAFAVRAPPEPTSVDPATVGDVEGVVVDGSGAPIAGAFVRISDGLERFRFDPPAEAVELGNEGRGFVPTFAVVRTFQPVLLRSHDDELHTARAMDAAGVELFNYPVIAGGERTFMFHQEAGVVRLGCKVHGEQERAAELVVSAHPYFAVTDDGGRFRLEGVPPGQLELAAWTAARGEVESAFELRTGETSSLRLVFP